MATLAITGDLPQPGEWGPIWPEKNRWKVTFSKFYLNYNPCKFDQLKCHISR